MITTTIIQIAGALLLLLSGVSMLKELTDNKVNVIYLLGIIVGLIIILLPL